MKIQSNNLETPEEKYQSHLKKWTKLGLIQENKWPRQNVRYIKLFNDRLTLKLYPVADNSYHGPTPKRQVASFENIKAWWMAQGQPIITVYVGWDEYFYEKFKGYSKDYDIMRS